MYKDKSYSCFQMKDPVRLAHPKKYPKKNQTKETSTLCAISLI